MAQMEASHMRLPTSLPGHTHAAAFVHVSHLMGGVHQRGGRRAAHRAAHRGAVGPERSGRSILKLTSLRRCAGPQEAAFCILRAMRHRGCYGISGRVFEHRAVLFCFCQFLLCFCVGFGLGFWVCNLVSVFCLSQAKVVYSCKAIF